MKTSENVLYVNMCLCLLTLVQAFIFQQDQISVGAVVERECKEERVCVHDAVCAYQRCVCAYNVWLRAACVWV